jgi:hypothetical protein
MLFILNFLLFSTIFYYFLLFLIFFNFFLQYYKFMEDGFCSGYVNHCGWIKPLFLLLKAISKIHLIRQNVWRPALLRLSRHSPFLGQRRIGPRLAVGRDLLFLRSLQGFIGPVEVMRHDDPRSDPALLYRHIRR